MIKGGFEVMQPHDQLWGNCPSSSNRVAISELSQWVEHVTRQLVEDLPDSIEEVVVPDEALQGSGSSSGSMLKVKDGGQRVEVSCNGESRPAKVARRSGGDNDDSGDDYGMRLMSLLMECAVAISVDNLGEAHKMLLELTQMSSPYGPSCAERIVAYFAKAMGSRVINSWLGICTPLVNYKSIHTSFQVFNNISPFIKFAHFTSNQTILEAVSCSTHVHIIDLDIMQGLQWPALFHILATRPQGPPHVRMTCIGPAPQDLLAETGRQLSGFARRLGLSFEFRPIGLKFGEIEDVSVLQLRRGEAVAVHWLQHSLYDATGPDRKTLKLLSEIGPAVITLVEQEISHGGGSSSFLDRFVGSLHYYSTIFDSLGAALPWDHRGRLEAEHGLLGREIHNVLAVGGPARSGEEKFRRWRNELMANGFLQVGMSRNSIAQAHLILNNMSPLLGFAHHHHHGHGYTLVEGDGTLRLGWKDTSLYTASAWTSPSSPHNF